MTQRRWTAVGIVLSLAVTLLAMPIAPVSATTTVKTERIGGDNRFETAANIAKATFPRGTTTALVARGDFYPDALAGSSLAGARNAPILLVLPDTIPTATSNGLRSLGVRDVVLLGGPAAISDGVQAQFAAAGYNVSRVFGANRYATSAEVARRTAVTGVGSVSGKRTAFLATGLNFPDALGAGPLSFSGRLPVFLTQPDLLPPEVEQAMKDLSVQHVVILGGVNAVNEAVKTKVESLGITTQRLSGANRAETATRVADYALASLGFEGINTALARGDGFADALSGGPNAGTSRAPILLTASSCSLAAETKQWLTDHFSTVALIRAYGGVAAICDPVLNEARDAAQTNAQTASKVALDISGGSSDGGPKWQYQQAGASPAKELTLKATATTDPAPGAADSTRPAAPQQDVIFNIKPAAGSDPANTELNLTGRTDANGVATVKYSRSKAGTDNITLSLKNAAAVQDTGTAVWGTEATPIALTPDTPQTIKVNEARTFTVTVPSSPTSAPGQDINITSLELLDDLTFNDTNKAALTFTTTDAATTVTPDTADNDQTLAIVRVAQPGGSGTFTVRSNAPQTVTFMAFLDTVTSGNSDDNVDRQELRDKAGQTTWTSGSVAINVTPAFLNADGTPGSTTKANGQQRVYTVSAVNADGSPFTQPLDVSFDELTDNDAATTTRGEIDWFDNDATLTTQEGIDDQVPSGATPVAEGATRVEVVPNAEGRFTFAITTDREGGATAPSNATPIVWLDLPSLTPNRLDPDEPRAKGQRTVYNAVSITSHTLESLGCPAGTPQRGTPDSTAGADGSPFNRTDPCLGRDTLTGELQQGTDGTQPWPLDVAAGSTSANAATCTPTSGTCNRANPGSPSATAISHGDIVFRFTYRDQLSQPVEPGAIAITFKVTNRGGTSLSAAPNRPNEGSDEGSALNVAPGIQQDVDNSVGAGAPTFVVVPLTPACPNNTPAASCGTVNATSLGIAEIVVDSDNFTNATSTSANGLVNVEVNAVRLATSQTIAGCSGPGVPQGCAPIVDSASWVRVAYDTTEVNTLPTYSLAQAATNCSAGVTQCYNGNVIAVDKARNYFVMNGAPIGASALSKYGTAYVAFHQGTGGEVYSNPALTTRTGERYLRNDSYFVDGVTAPVRPQDGAAGYGSNAGRCQPSFVSSIPSGTAPGYNLAGIPGCAWFDFYLTPDDRMVYEWDETTTTFPGVRTQRHRLTNSAGAPTFQ